MKQKYKTHTSRHLHNGSSKNAQEVDFESLASQLDQLAKFKLPDGCLDGVLAGQEPEIRQDAMLLALRWYAQSTSKEEWHAARSLSYALRYIKMRYARRLFKQPENVQLDEEVIPVSLVIANPETMPMSDRPHATHMAIQAIHHATHHGQITPANAAIVLMVLQDGYEVSTIARKLNLGLGTIYYHLNRVRAFMPSIVASIEEPGYQTM